MCVCIAMYHIITKHCAVFTPISEKTLSCVYTHDKTSRCVYVCMHRHVCHGIRRLRCVCTSIVEKTVWCAYTNDNTSRCVYMCIHRQASHRYAYMGWLRSVGSIKLYVSFTEYRLFYRPLLQKRPIILSILLTVATPYMNVNVCVCVIARLLPLPPIVNLTLNKGPTKEK